MCYINNKARYLNEHILHFAPVNSFVSIACTRARAWYAHDRPGLCLFLCFALLFIKIDNNNEIVESYMLTCTATVRVFELKLVRINRHGAKARVRIN